ncbi:AraC family transcriptional regulator [Streptomyces ipomoeae]|jgi:AraC-like DNA-binding protein/quercetin dioxygenase-like cupin family protein|uniref:AraC family transcriptional regulator n=1 Tax=Streptomyces ipomoeae TaxID=103232 RepID=UPI0029CA43DD|nr:helix-turn-helix transcriptional regulator [Streptomyces ipomoeae]
MSPNGQRGGKTEGAVAARGGIESRGDTKSEGEGGDEGRVESEPDSGRGAERSPGRGVEWSPGRGAERNPAATLDRYPAATLDRYPAATLDRYLRGHPTAIFIGHFTMPRGTSYARHWHPVHQLAWSAKGLLRVTTRQGSWLLPPTLALWIPAGVPHITESAGDTVMRSPYVAPESCPTVDWQEPTVVAVGPLLRALIDHLVRTDLTAGARSRAEAVLLDVLDPVPVTSVSAPEPRDPRAREVARALAANPSDPRPLDAWGTQVGAGARTLARLFVTETGLTFGQWREQTRMRAAMPLLAEGLPLESVAHRVGYASASSFVAAFRRIIGVTPREYFPVHR